MCPHLLGHPVCPIVIFVLDDLIKYSIVFYINYVIHCNHYC